MAIAAAGRGAWGSRIGFILAAAGSAVGLGNIWGFPTQVGRGGGAAFVVLYLLCVFLICAPIMIAEIVIGRRAQKDPVTSFRVLRPGSAWWLTGMLGVLTGVGILSFYSVIAGKDLVSVVTQLETIASANAALTEYHTGRRASLATA